MSANTAIITALSAVEVAALKAALDTLPDDPNRPHKAPSYGWHERVGYMLPAAISIEPGGEAFKVESTIMVERVCLAAAGLLTPLGYEIATELKDGP